MKTTEYEHIICMMYCKRNGKGGDACSNCKLSPATQNNFIFNPDVETLIELLDVWDKLNDTGDGRKCKPQDGWVYIDDIL